MLHILSRMLARPELPRSGATNLEEFLRAASDIVQRRSLVFVVSDFISAPGWAKPLSHFTARNETKNAAGFNTVTPPPPPDSGGIGGKGL